MGLVVGPPTHFYHLRVLGEGLSLGYPEGSSQRFLLLVGDSSGELQEASSYCPGSGMPWSDEGCHCLIPSLGIGVFNVGDTRTDLMSAVACGWVVASISKRRLKKHH